MRPNKIILFFVSTPNTHIFISSDHEKLPKRKRRLWGRAYKYNLMYWNESWHFCPHLLPPNELISPGVPDRSCVGVVVLWGHQGRLLPGSDVYLAIRVPCADVSRYYYHHEQSTWSVLPYCNQERRGLGNASFTGRGLLNERQWARKAINQMPECHFSPN